MDQELTTAYILNASQAIFVALSHNEKLIQWLINGSFL